ncbi:hypothetical protein [Fontivita pretiosa]|uniref:hypothetical protein n=1 Tax=Fontivita pretiosa TaxID=2989684 RepID=UPI003D182455
MRRWMDYRSVEHDPADSMSMLPRASVQLGLLAALGTLIGWCGVGIVSVFLLNQFNTFLGRWLSFALDALFGLFLGFVQSFVLAIAWRKQQLGGTRNEKAMVAISSMLLSGVTALFISLDYYVYGNSIDPLSGAMRSSGIGTAAALGVFALGTIGIAFAVRRMVKTQK